jgi:arginine repressor
MVVTNMKELCEYNRQKKLARKHKHIELIKIYGECKGMGNKKYKLPQKSSFPKQYKAAYNKIWR